MRRPKSLAVEAPGYYLLLSGGGWILDVLLTLDSLSMPTTAGSLYGVRPSPHGYRCIIPFIHFYVRWLHCLSFSLRSFACGMVPFSL